MVAVELFCGGASTTLVPVKVIRRGNQSKNRFRDLIVINCLPGVTKSFEFVTLRDGIEHLFEVFNSGISVQRHIGHSSKRASVPMLHA